MTSGNTIRQTFARWVTSASGLKPPRGLVIRAHSLPYSVITLFFLVLVLLSPGLYGVYYLDDFPNLSPLALVGEPGGFWYVVLGGGSGPLGRPVSLFSFALQADQWPASPFSFKFVNLVLHGLNGVLVLAVTRALLELSPLEVRWPVVVSAAAALLWSLAPIHLSSVFYVVQRMNLLAALFTLLGLSGYLAARSLWLQGRNTAGYVLASISFVLCLSFGVLSKENAVLLPLYVLVLEATLLGGVPRPAGWRAWCSAFLCLPLLVLAGYLALEQRYLDVSTAQLERLLTETRVLMDYLTTTLWPPSGRLGLFHDDFPPSRGLLDPPSTLISVVILVAALSAALAMRRRQPVLALAVLWFLGGHSLESTMPGLELYFEHRNYLPSYGPVLALAWYSLQLAARTPSQTVKRLIITAGLTYLGLVAFHAHHEARLWGDPQAMVKAKLRNHPDSLRVRLSAASDLSRAGDFVRASEMLRTHGDRHGIEVGVLVRILYLRCFEPRIEIPDGDDWLRHLASAPYDRTLVATLNNLVSSKHQGECAGVSYPLVERVLTAVLENPRFHPDRTQLNLLLARTRDLAGDYGGLMSALTAAVSAEPRPELLLLRANYAIGHGRLEEAQQFLTEAEEAIRIIDHRHPLTAALFDLGRLERHRLGQLTERLAHAQRSAGEPYR